MAEMQKRLQYVDVFKAIAVILVVLYHLIAPNIGKPILNHLMDSFLASFFFFSGYFHKPGKRSMLENIKNRAASLMGPFLKYSLFFWAIGSVYLVMTNQAPFMETLYCLRNFFAGCIWNRTIQDWFGWEYYSLGKRYFFLADFWFLLAMLFGSILFFIVVDKVIHSKVKTLVCAACLFGLTGIFQYGKIMLPYNMQMSGYWAGYMLVGALAGNEKIFEKEGVSDLKKWGWAIIALVIGITIAMMKTPSTNQFRGTFGENEILSMVLCIITALSIIYGLTQILVLLEKKGLNMDIGAWVGSNSLIFYLYHMFFAWMICSITGFSIRYEEVVSNDIFFKSILLTIVCIGLCSVMVWLEDKWKQRNEAKS